MWGSMSALNSDLKRARVLRGLAGEERALAFLCERGYGLVKQRYVCRGGEIDLIMQGEGALLLFVEVKCHTSLESALESITATKRRRITHAAQLYLQENPCYEGWDVRFDVVAISPHGIEHIHQAWIMEE